MVDPAGRWHFSPTSADIARHHACGAGLALIAGIALLVGGTSPQDMEAPAMPLSIDFVAVPPDPTPLQPEPVEPQQQPEPVPPEAGVPALPLPQAVAPEPEPEPEPPVPVPETLPPVKTPIPDLKDMTTQPVRPSPVQPARPSIAPQPARPARPRPPIPAVPSATAIPGATPAAAIPPVAQPAMPTPGDLAAFRTSMHDVVQSALFYPPALRMAGQGGDVRIEFDFEDGRVSNPVPVSHGPTPLLDNAAIRTVVSAHYPLPPPSLAHRILHLSVLVHFDPSRP